MKVLHVGGVADGEEIELNENVRSGVQTFKMSNDFPLDPLRSHSYSRHFFKVKRKDSTEETVSVMVWDHLPSAAMLSLVQARLCVSVIE